MRWLRRLALDISPLRASRDFRLLWSGSVVSAMGSQFARVGLYVQVYALTGSPAAVGLLGLSGLAGSLAGVFVGASFIDRHDRRITLLWSQLAAMAVAVILVAGAVSGHPSLWLLHAANAATWFLAAIHGPARQASIPRMLADEQVPAAVALNQAGWQVASIVGPALAGFLIARERTGGRLRRRRRHLHHRIRAAALALRPLPPDKAMVERGVPSGRHRTPVPPRRPAPAIDVRDRPRRDDLREPAGVDARDRRQQLHRGPEVVGLLFAAPAAGALLVTLVSGPLTRMRRQGDAVVWAVVAWGAAITAFGLSGDRLYAALFFLAVAGAADVVSAIFRSTILQVTVPDHLRGRLGAVFFIVVTGGPKLGDIEAGLVASAFTARSAW